MCMNFLPTYVSVYYVHACLRRPEEGIGTPGTGVTNGCKLLNVGPLEEQLLLLAIERFLQPLVDQLIR